MNAGETTKLLESGRIFCIAGFVVFVTPSIDCHCCSHVFYMLYHVEQ